jgi:hypothetical protein
MQLHHSNRRYLDRFQRKILLVLAVVPVVMSTAQTASAQGTLGVHTITRHEPRRDYHQEENYGLYYRTAGGIEFGGYRNTLDRPTFYLAQTWQWHFLSATLGVLTGYRKRQVEVPCVDGSAGPCYETRGNTNGMLGPLAAVSATTPPLWGVAARLTVLPGFLVNSSTVYHLSFEHPM